MGILVSGKRHVSIGRWLGKGVIRSNGLSVSNRRTRQVHAALPSPYWQNSRVRTSFIILGSGQDGGSPQVGQRGSASVERAASSVAVIGPDGSVILLDATPDLRKQSQMLLSSDRYPKDRSVFLDGVFITHAHMGHYGGLIHFGNEAAATKRLPLFGSERFLAFLEHNEPWRALITRGHVEPVPLDGVTAAIESIISVEAIPVPHRDEFSDTVALSVAVDGRPWLLYLPDIDAWELWEDAEAEISRHDVALLDATFSTADELPGRDMSAIGHPLVPQTIQSFRHLTRETHIILTHINHSNPLGDPTAAITQQASVAGFSIAYDGLTLDTVPND